MTIEVYTDGGCSPNPGPGGWGAVMRWKGHEKELSGGEHDTTNNRMELTAVIKALEAVTRPGVPIEVYTDSQYVRNGIQSWTKAWIKNGWRKKDKSPVQNADLWKRLVELTKVHQVHFNWVRGHAGNPMNERADRLSHRDRPRLTA
ncbi:ribonuclease HI [Aureimonas sp. AU40]|uniref:ribonuclease HI n=1 Tax=Aureimonas sp. AU40 TaxID=1637747 RepID=UPI00078654F2|nr:ribonuclease HI [Aureimonas sp. AU40]